MVLIRSLIAAAPGALRAPAARSGPSTIFFGGSVGAAEARDGATASSEVARLPAVSPMVVRTVVILTPDGGRPDSAGGEGWWFGWCARCRGRSAPAAAAAGPVRAGRPVGWGRGRDQGW